MNEERRGYDARIDEVHDELKDLKERLEPVIEVWTALTGLVTVLKWVGRIAKWLAAVAAGVGAWMFFSRGGPH